jgi:hypothetical protein
MSKRLGSVAQARLSLIPNLGAEKHAFVLSPTSTGAGLGGTERKHG